MWPGAGASGRSSIVRALLSAVCCMAGAAVADQLPGGARFEAWISGTAFPTATGALPRALSVGGAITPSRTWGATLALEGTMSLWLPIPVQMWTAGPGVQFQPWDRLWVTLGPEVTVVHFPDLGQPKGETLLRGGGFVRTSFRLGDSLTLVLRGSVYSDFAGSSLSFISLGLGGRPPPRSA